MFGSRRRGRGYLVSVLFGIVGAGTGLGGCANVAPPPGGPPDSVAPMLIAVRPDSFAILPDYDEVAVFEFDESISEQNIQAAVILFPFQGRPEVDKGSRELEVRPRGGWVSGRIYHIRVQPVIQDLFNNTIPRHIHHVFSTGPPIPENVVRGTVFDRLTGRALPSARLDMVSMPDSLRYGTPVDSVGDFRLAWLPPGDYLAIGYEDRNSNSRADDRDRSDTLRVSLGPEDTLALEFHVFEHDTVPPTLTEVQPIDSVTLELSFEEYLDPEAKLDTFSVDLYSLAEDSALPLERVLHLWEYEAWRDSLAAARAAADTLEAEPAADTLEAQPAEPDTARARRPAPAEQVQRAAAQGLQTQDTAAPAEPERLPARRIYVISRARVPPGEARIRLRGIVGLSGLFGGGELTFEQPAPAEPAPEEPPPEGPPPGEPPPGGASASTARPPRGPADG